MVSPEQPKSIRERLQALWVRWGYAAIAASIFLVVGFAATAILDARVEGRRRVELVSFTSLLQTRLRRELDSALFLTGGLKSYLVVRQGVLVRSEVDAILRQLHQDSRHVRNFGIAIGYRLLYVYPIRGNEKVFGLDYRKVPSQMAAVQRLPLAGKRGNGLYRIRPRIEPLNPAPVVDVIEKQRRKRRESSERNPHHEISAISLFIRRKTWANCSRCSGFNGSSGLRGIPP